MTPMAPMTPAIMCAEIRKRFGHAEALQGVDLVVPAGSVFGLVGPNGAGKSTLLRILLGLETPTSGAAAVLGRDVVSASREIRARAGVVLESDGHYARMNAVQNLTFFAHIYGVAAH